MDRRMFLGTLAGGLLAAPFCAEGRLLTTRAVAAQPGARPRRIASDRSGLSATTSGWD